MLLLEIINITKSNWMAFCAKGLNKAYYHLKSIRYFPRATLMSCPPRHCPMEHLPAVSQGSLKWSGYVCVSAHIFVHLGACTPSLPRPQCLSLRRRWAQLELGGSFKVAHLKGKEMEPKFHTTWKLARDVAVICEHHRFEASLVKRRTSGTAFLHT